MLARAHVHTNMRFHSCFIDHAHRDNEICHQLLRRWCMLLHARGVQPLWGSISTATAGASYYVKVHKRLYVRCPSALWVWISPKVHSMRSVSSSSDDGR